MVWASDCKRESLIVVICVGITPNLGVGLVMVTGTNTGSIDLGSRIGYRATICMLGHLEERRCFDVDMNLPLSTSAFIEGSELGRCTEDRGHNGQERDNDVEHVHGC